MTALLGRNYRFTQIGNMEILAELRESGWSINDRLKSFARVMTGPEIDRTSIGHLLARLLVDCSGQAPDDAGLAAFHLEYVAACHTAGRPDDPREVYEMTATAAHDLLTRRINRVSLPPQLMATTTMVTPFCLAGEARKIAKRRTTHMFQRLSAGGLTLEPCSTGRLPAG